MVSYCLFTNVIISLFFLPLAHGLTSGALHDFTSFFACPVMQPSTYRVVSPGCGWCQVRGWQECLETKGDSKGGTEVQDQTHSIVLGSTMCWRSVSL